MMLQNASNGSATPCVQHADVTASSSNTEGQQVHGMQSRPEQDGLRPAALRMRLEMPLKERIIHLQTFKFTFTGQQAVSFLQQQGLANSQDVAVDMCQRMLTQGMFKSIYHRDVFLPDGEIYRFSSSFPDGSNKQKGRIPGSITSTGLYKEIAKIGKTAAQPFKNIQLSLNDTFNSLGSLSIPTAVTKPGQLGSSLAGVRPRSSSGGAGRSGMRRSQAGKLHHMYADGTHGPPDSASSLAALVNSMEVLQANIKDSTSLLRLDLQQHTALQEHLVGLFMSQQEQLRFTQSLIAINAASALLLLGCSGSWVATFAAGILLAVLLYSFGPDVFNRIRQPPVSRIDSLLARGSISTSRGLDLQRVSRAPGGAAPRSVSAPIEGFSLARERSDEETHTDEDNDTEGSIPYSEDFDDWPDAPVMLRPDPVASHQDFGAEATGPCHALSANSDPIPFESELFKGVVAIYIRHLPTTPTHLFQGKKRLAWVALQGVFKQPVSMDNLVYGMEFRRQLCNLPAPWFLENMLLPLARKISPSLRVGTLEDPFFFSPIITASQVVNVSLPGQAPSLMEAKEDTRLLQQELGGKAGDGLTVPSRRKYFQAAANRNMTYSRQYVWTFHLWQEYIDFASYMLNLGYSSYDLTQHLDGQPLQVMAKDESTGQQLISLHVWHANLARCSSARVPHRSRANRVSNVSHDDALTHERAMFRQIGLDGELTVDSPSAQEEQHHEQQTPPQHKLQQQQQQQHQQQHSSPLPVIYPLSHQPSPHMQQQGAAAQQQHQHQQQQQSQSASDPQQPSMVPCAQLLQQQQQQPQQPQQPVSAAVHDLQQGNSSHRLSKGAADVFPPHKQQQQQVPDLPFGSSLSETYLQRPVGRGVDETHSDSSGSRTSTNPDAGIHSLSRSATRASSLRPMLQAATVPGPLHPQLSLPTQQLVRHRDRPEVSLPRSEEHCPSTTPNSGAAAAVCAGGRDQGIPACLSPVSSGASAGSTGGTHTTDVLRMSHASGPHAGVAPELPDTPLPPLAASAAAAGEEAGPTAPGTAGLSWQQQHVVQAQQQTSAQEKQPQSAQQMQQLQQIHEQQQQQQVVLRAHSSKKKKEPREKEEQQRQQLHGLSVMGAL